MTTAHDPEPLSALTACAEASVRDLAALRCNDPATRDALRAAKLTAHTIRSFWLPTLEGLRDQSG